MTDDRSAPVDPLTAAVPAGFTAVIADDDPDIAALMEIAVRRAGGSVVAVAHEGVGALDRIRDLRPDVALLDVSMPGLSGLDVCRLVRNASSGSADLTSASGTPRGPLVVLLSAAVHPEAIAQGLDAGADRYLTKPFSPRSLAVQLQEVLQAGGTRP